MNIQQRIDKSIDKKWKKRIDSEYLARFKRCRPDEHSLRDSIYETYKHAIINAIAFRERTLRECIMLTDEQVKSLSNFEELYESNALLVIEDHGDYLVPAFQFEKQGKLFESAVRVNTFFGAKDNAWSVISWWCSPIEYTQHITPSDFIADQERVMHALSTTVR